MSSKYAVLIDSATKIKIEITTCHLWLEGVKSGGRDLELEAVLNHLNNADWFKFDYYKYNAFK